MEDLNSNNFQNPIIYITCISNYLKTCFTFYMYIFSQKDSLKPYYATNKIHVPV